MQNFYAKKYSFGHKIKNETFFIKEEFDKDMERRITDPRYGEGTIVNVEQTEEGYWITVLFDEETVGERKLLSFINPLEIRK